MENWTRAPEWKLQQSKIYARIIMRFFPYDELPYIGAGSPKE